MYGIIYKVTDITNGKEYIGKTSRSIKARWWEHERDAIRKNSQLFFHRAIRKHGSNNFKLETVTECETLEELNEKEQYYIRHFNTLSPNGYNLTLGGEGGIPCQEVKDKISKSKTGKPSWNKGKKQSKETIEKKSKSLTGRQFSAEHKASLSAVNKKPIICKENGKIYPSTKEAAQELKVFASNIFKVLNGIYKQTGGYTFSYHIVDHPDKL